jgi:hypothetical protein
MTIRPNHWRDDLIRPNTREATNKILEMIDECVLDPKDVVMMCLKWMSEDDVAAMAEANEINLDKKDDEEI